jgi:glyoxylase-like metal-dependent hydrolase (beta-lactamase superfamily II)
VSATNAPLTTTIDDLPVAIDLVALPTPFPVGPVNCYLLLGDPLTIVDPGMLWGDNMQVLDGALAGHGRKLADIKQIVVTHGHPDHFGAAGWVAEQSSATVICGRLDAPKHVGGVGGAGAAFRSTDLSLRLGLPGSLFAMFSKFYEGVTELTHPIPDGRLRVLDDGDTLEAGGREWQVHVTPGHSVGHVSLYDPSDRTLLSGDHLLACITPNPVLEPEPDEPDGRRRSLVEYLASLDRFVRLDPLRVLPGHGPCFRDVLTLVDETRRHHQERATEIFRIVESLGESTPYELSRALFPHLEDFTVMLGVSEAVGHLDLLEADGRIRRVSDHPQRNAIA